MNTSLSAYTHLESLLLFQSLNAYGVKHALFSSISELLKNNPDVRSDKRFQSGRLSPDALRNFFLQLLSEEARSEQGQDGLLDGEVPNGEVKNPRKRKAPSPIFPTIQEAAKDAHLVPKLVTKLYARYRKAIIHDIRDEEDRYKKLQRELQSIERGERDSDLVERANGKSPGPHSPSVTGKSSPLQQKSLASPSPNPQLAVQDGDRLATPAQVVDGPQQAPAVLQPPLAPPHSLVEADGKEKKVPKASPRKKKQEVPPSTPRPPANAGLAPAPTPPPQQNHTPQPVGSPSPFPQSQPTSIAYNGPPPPLHQASPFLVQGPQPPAQTAQGAPLPASPHAPTQGPSQPPQLPATLPHSGSQLQPQPIQPYGPNGVPQHHPVPGASSQFSPASQQFQGSLPPGPQSPSVQTPQQQRNLHSYPVQPPPHAGQPPPQSGFMLPPFQVSPQDPSRAQQPPQYPQVATPVARQQPLSAKAGSAATGLARQGLPQTQTPIFQFRGSMGSISTPLSARTPYSNAGTPRSIKALWKPMVKNVASPETPRPDMSPIDDIAPLGQQKQSQQKSKVTRKSRGRTRAKEKEKEVDQESEPQPGLDEPEEQVPEMETRRGRNRRIATSRRVRPGSIASSQAGGSIRERSRSQSVISHTETVAGETESQVGTRVKSERGTSIDVIEEDTVQTPSQPTGRRRGGAGQSRGRKRTAREASLEESEDTRQESPEQGPSTSRVVIAPRHFSRMCNPIMNDIGSHKHASTFTTAVKSKDAEGYYEIIKRPTDLKTIQKAIAAGGRVVAAAASSDTPGGSPGGAGGTVELPLSADVVPPKAIVNSAQLEKELMRMFVNAVMFNAGEEGVVQDAREMFESVQSSVSSWRTAERATGRVEIEETPVLEEDVSAQPTASKKRKL